MLWSDRKITLGRLVFSGGGSGNGRGRPSHIARGAGKPGGTLVHFLTPWQAMVDPVVGFRCGYFSAFWINGRWP